LRAILWQGKQTVKDRISASKLSVKNDEERTKALLFWHVHRARTQDKFDKAVAITIYDLGLVNTEEPMAYGFF
jgi:hypothetical protein